jgi:HSP20 family protein
MNVRRFNSGLPVGQLRREMDRLFEDFFGPGGTAPRFGLPSARVFPALNVWEEGDNLVAEAELPGLKPEDVDISVVGNELTVKGRRGGQEVEGATYHRRERGVGEFSRVVRLPVEVDGDRVQASLQNGVLRIMLPRSEASKPRKIHVSGGQA